MEWFSGFALVSSFRSFILLFLSSHGLHADKESHYQVRELQNEWNLLIINISHFYMHWLIVLFLSFAAKKSFYMYSLVLSLLNLIQAIGSALFYVSHIEGLCIVDVTTYLYFTLFTPLVYWTFLAEFFHSTQSVIMFSYKPQVDECADESADIAPRGSSPSHQLPHQLSCSSLKTDNDFIFQRTALYESTQFAASSSSFSPDSITTNHSINQSMINQW